LAGLEGVVALAERTGVNDVRLAPVTVPGESPLCLAAVPAEVREALGRVRAAAATRGVRVSLTASMFEGHWPPSGEDACIHPWAYCYVAYDGRVGFCDHLIGPAGDPFLMGDLRTQSFDEVWNGEPWVALRGEHVGARSAHAPRFEECAWCYRNRHLDFEDLLEPSFAAGRAILA
jgi:MoaA/NifB/PqqE/SkfB family radical SAM enzyme